MDRQEKFEFGKDEKCFPENNSSDHVQAVIVEKQHLCGSSGESFNPKKIALEYFANGASSTEDEQLNAAGPTHSVEKYMHDLHENFSNRSVRNVAQMKESIGSSNTYEQDFIEELALKHCDNKYTGGKPLFSVKQNCENVEYSVNKYVCNHTHEKSSCKICGKNFKNEIQINSNIETKMPVQGKTRNKKFTCDVCNEVFFCRKDVFTAHIRRHTEEKPYKCDVCDKEFTTKSKLTTHIHIHTGEKPFKCDVCNKMFTSKESLIPHMRIHTGEKPHKCHTCDKCFLRSGDLVRHTRTHTGEKPYKCDICDKYLAYKRNLREHLRTHTGDKPYKCDVCDSSFTKNSSLKIHIRLHTGEKPYKCDICDKSFHSRTLLNDHLRIHAG